MRLILYMVSLVLICALALIGNLVFQLYTATSATIIGIGGVIAVSLVYLAAQRSVVEKRVEDARPARGRSTIGAKDKKDRKESAKADLAFDFEMPPSPTSGSPDGRMRLFEDHLSMGRNLIRCERYLEAADILQKAINLEPEHSKTYNYLGIAFGRMERFEESAAAYQKAISIDYDYASAHFNLALVYERLNRRREALECWMRYVDIGEVTGEREDMLDRARGRIRELS